MTQTEIIPFGKHKGKPIEAVAEIDRQYVDWIVQQSWFQEKYGNLYTIIINNFKEPTNTPEHNSIQIKFSNEDFLRKFYHVFRQRYQQSFDNHAILPVMDMEGYLNDNRELYNDYFTRFEIKLPQTPSIYLKADPEFEREGWDVCLSYRYIAKELSIKSRLESYDEYNTSELEIESKLADPDMLYYQDSADKERDSNNILSPFEANNIIIIDSVNIEIKPTVSDDFPEVLRQMKSRRNNFCREHQVLYLREYHGQGATEEEFIRLFNIENILVIFEHEIEEDFVYNPSCPDWILPYIYSEEGLEEARQLAHDRIQKKLIDYSKELKQEKIKRYEKEGKRLPRQYVGVKLEHEDQVKIFNEGEFSFLDEEHGYLIKIQKL